MNELIQLPSRYPYSWAQLRADNLGTSLRETLDDVTAEVRAARLAEWNCYEVTPVSAPSGYDKALYTLAKSAEQVGDVWQQKWELVPRPLNDVKAALLLRAENKWSEVMQLGFVYEFPDGMGTVQTRDNGKDMVNINGLVTGALVKVVQAADPEQIFTAFRDHEDVNHPLTPLQTMVMGMSALSYVSGQYAVKWVKRTEIDAFESFEEAEAFDMDSGWGQVD